MTLREYQRAPARRSWPVVAERLDRLRAALRRGGHRGRRQPGRDQPARRATSSTCASRGCADAPVLLVGDIDRGGVFAALRRHAGAARRPTSARAWPRLRHQQVPRRRRRCSRPGSTMLRGAHRRAGARRGAVPDETCICPTEDSLDLGRALRGAGRAPAARTIDIAVVRLPRIANFDDFEPLAAEPGVRAALRRRAAPSSAAPTWSILPGTKSTSPTWPGCASAGSPRRRGAARARAARPRASAAATRCSAAPRRPRRRRAAPARGASGSACSTPRRCSARRRRPGQVQRRGRGAGGLLRTAWAASGCGL